MSTVCFGKGIIKMAAIGNSVSQGTNAAGVGVYPEYSWSTGTKIESHRVLLEKMRNVKVIAKNVSIVGANSSILHLELNNLGKFKPDYATIEIGANDVCWNMTKYYIKNIKKAIEWLIERNPNIEIIVIPIPKITSMPKAVNSTQCKAVWNIACPYLLGSNLTESQRKARQTAIDELNYKLAEMVEDFPQVSIRPEVAYQDIQAEDISGVDCFHPSIEGQKKLAWLTYMP
jgi:lysophospholipase L1-like esterase